MSTSFAVDVTQARQYLRILAEGEGAHVSLNHLLVATVARVLAAHPAANTRMIGRQFIPLTQVGVAMPVNLLGHGGDSRELSMMIVERADVLSLRAIAAVTRQTVHEERRGRVQNPLAKLAFAAVTAAGLPLAHVGFNAVNRVMQTPVLAKLVYEMVPVSTVVTNPGSVFGDAQGLWMRGGAMAVPNRLIHVPTIWGASPVQDEVVPVEGVPCVRPLLPMLMIFDHRVIDGVRAGQLIRDFSEILQDPARYFGESGELPGPSTEILRAKNHSI